MKTKILPISVALSVLLSTGVGVLHFTDSKMETTFPYEVAEEADAPIIDDAKTYRWYIKSILYMKVDTNDIVAQGPFPKAKLSLDTSYLLREHWTGTAKGVPGVNWFNVIDPLPDKYGDWTAIEMERPIRIK